MWRCRPGRFAASGACAPSLLACPPSRALRARSVGHAWSRPVRPSSRLVSSFPIGFRPLRHVHAAGGRGPERRDEGAQLTRHVGQARASAAKRRGHRPRRPRGRRSDATAPGRASQPTSFAPLRLCVRIRLWGLCDLGVQGHRPAACCNSCHGNEVRRRRPETFSRKQRSKAWGSNLQHPMNSNSNYNSNDRRGTRTQRCTPPAAPAVRSGRSALLMAAGRSG